MLLYVENVVPRRRHIPPGYRHLDGRVVSRSGYEVRGGAFCDRALRNALRRQKDHAAATNRENGEKNAFYRDPVHDQRSRGNYISFRPLPNDKGAGSKTRERESVENNVPINTQYRPPVQYIYIYNGVVLFTIARADFSIFALKFCVLFVGGHPPTPLSRLVPISISIRVYRRDFRSGEGKIRRFIQI